MSDLCVTLVSEKLIYKRKLPASPAVWRFWHLVSGKNTCVGIPKGINRGALL